MSIPSVGFWQKTRNPFLSHHHGRDEPGSENVALFSKAPRAHHLAIFKGLSAVSRRICKNNTKKGEPVHEVHICVDFGCELCGGTSSCIHAPRAGCQEGEELVQSEQWPAAPAAGSIQDADIVSVMFFDCYFWLSSPLCRRLCRGLFCKRRFHDGARAWSVDILSLR